MDSGFAVLSATTGNSRATIDETSGPHPENPLVSVAIGKVDRGAETEPQEGL